MQPPRLPWDTFPDVLIHAAESRVKQHPAYLAAKCGDAAAALQLVNDTFDLQQLDILRRLVGNRRPILVTGADYVMVDDFVGMGGTLANLRGHIESHGGRVSAAVVLTGKPHSAKLQLSPERLKELRNTHGTELEHWWKERFGHAFDALTESEARYLVRTPDVATVRNRIAAAEQAGDRPHGGAG